MPELDIQAILERLDGGGVEFIVIGGVAVGFHGYVRATKNLDVVPAPDRPNLERLVMVLRGLEAELDGAGEFEAAELPLGASTLELGGNWVLQTRLGRLGGSGTPNSGRCSRRPRWRSRWRASESRSRAMETSLP